MSARPHLLICIATEPGEWSTASFAADLGLTQGCIIRHVAALRKSGLVAPNDTYRLNRRVHAARPIPIASESTMDAIWEATMAHADDLEPGRPQRIAAELGLSVKVVKRVMTAFRQAGDITPAGLLFPTSAGVAEVDSLTRACA